MVDQSERAFRLLCRRYGVDLAYTPMIHAEPFVASEEFRRAYFDAWEAAEHRGVVDRPLIAQLGGDDPLTLLRAGQMLEPFVDAIDLNFGCPTEDARIGGHNSHSPRCRRYGAYLLRSVPLIQRIVGTLSQGLKQVPVTAKMRLQASDGETVETALAIEEAGAAALCVHGRTVLQRPKYADRDRSGAAGAAARWAPIAAVRRAVGIPVIANGGVETREDALQCLEVTGAAAVMSAEALLEDPDLFASDGGLVGEGEQDVRRTVRLAREFLEISEAFPSSLKYPPTKSHLFKILHRLMGADQAATRQKEKAGESLSLMEEMKMALMVCKVHDLEAIGRALDKIESRYLVTPTPPLGPSWYRRWRTPKPAASERGRGQGRSPYKGRQGR